MRLETVIRLFAVFALILSSLFYYAEPLPAVAADPEPVLPPITLPKDGNPKLDSRLNRLVKEQSDNSSSRSSRAQPNSLRNSADSVRVIIETSTNQTGQVRQAAAGLGVVEASDGNLLQVTLPAGQLMALADLPGVRFVRIPYKPVEDVTSEGVGVIGANVWQSVGYNGTGVKIGIVDSGFAGYTTRQSEGELPASITTWWAPSLGGGPGTSVHGTGVAEIIYDIAPGAQYYFAGIKTDVEFGNAVDWLISQGVNVISASIGWKLTGPGDGTGNVDQAVDRARAAGILWVNAAGNEAQRHWSGTFNDSNGNGFNNFSGADEDNAVYATAESYISVDLKWDDPWGASSNDYDVYLFNSTSPTPVSGSANEQNGNDYPRERFDYLVPTTGWYYIVINKFAATRNVFFHLYNDAQNLEYRVESGSIILPADSPNAMTVGAIGTSSPWTIHSYSSQGPTVDGRAKPDIAAPSGVSTRAYSPDLFYGTSASAPHAAGAAVLVKQAFPSYNATQIQAFLEGRAVDLGTAGKDNVYGSGRLSLGALSPTVVTNNATHITTNSATLSGNLTSLGTASSVNVTFQWGAVSGNYTGVLSSNFTSTNSTMASAGEFTGNLTGLTPGVTYYFRARGVGDGTGYGAEKTFATSLITAPSVTTDNATSVTYNSARLNGTLVSLATASTVNVSFQYGTQSGNYTVNTTAQTMNATGSFSANVTSLSSNTTYYFRAKAVGDGTAYGSEKSLTTRRLPPTVATSNATGIATRVAMLNGNLQSLGDYTSVNVSFSYGTSSTNLSQSTPSQEKSASGNFSANVTFLSANTTYYYKARAAAGTEVIVYGDILSFTTLPRPTWGANMTAGTATGGSNLNLRFGAASNATDGFDANLDVPHVPPSPDATFDAYFYNAVATPFNKLDREYRTPADRMTWTVNISSPGQNVTLAWGIADIPSDLSVYMDAGAGAINMRTQNSTMLPAGNRSITISVSYDVEVSIDLKSGWNMVSVPVVLHNSTVSVVFPTALVVYAWNAATKSYSAVTSLEPGKGYWVAVTTNTTVALSGLPVVTWTANMSTGWNMIGSVISQASFAAPEDNPDSSVMAFTYWWDPVGKSYVLGATVEPGKGYWIAATRAASLTLSAGGGVASMGTSASSSGVGSGVIDAANKRLTPGIEFAHPPSPPDATVPVAAPPVTRGDAGAGGAGDDGDDGIGGGGGGSGGGGFAGIGSLPLSGIGGISPLINGATGVTMTPANLATNDGKVTIAIVANTTMLMSTGLAVTSLQAVQAVQAAPPGDPPPQGAIILNYNFGPDGATFDPPLAMTISYTDDQIPAGAAEANLFLAYWDGSGWVVIPSVTDAVNNTVTGNVAHFTNVALIAGAPAPQIPASPPARPAVPEPSSAPQLPLPVPPAPQPSPVPVPTPVLAPETPPADAPEPVQSKPSAGLSSWWWIIGAVIGAAIIGGLVYRIARTKDRQPNSPRE